MRILGSTVAGVTLAGAIMAGLAVHPAKADTTVKFGALLALSGPMASTGREVKDGIELAVADINARGGIKSLGGAKIEVVFGDTQAKPDVATSETERLVNREQVLGIMDMFPSVTTLAATQAAERLKVPYYVGISVADNITERGFKYTFQQLPVAAELAAFEIDFLGELEKAAGKKFERVAVVHEDGDFGQAISKSVVELLKKQGRQVIGPFSYPVRTTDVSTMLTRVKAGNPDLVIQASYIGDAILITRTAARLGINVPFIDSGGKAQQSYIDAMGAAADGSYVVTYWNKDIPGAKELNERYKAKTGKNMPSHAADLYQATIALSVALEQAGKADREALRNALAALEIKPGPNLILPYKQIKFDEKGLISGAGSLMARVTNGEFVTVWPKQYAPK